jgi:hypothetical protein
MLPMLTRPQSRPLRQTLLLGLLVLGIMIVGVSWLEGYVRDQFVSALQIGSQVDRGSRGWTGDRVDSLLNDILLVFGSLAILLAPMALALAIAETRPGGGGWKLLTFLCCTVAAWFLFFAETSGLVIALVTLLLAWACALAMRMSFNRRRA